MAYWLLAAISSYFFFGLASLFDKLVLAGRPKPNSYTFYVGIFSLFVIFLLPFAKFSLPDFATLAWIILYAIVHLAGLYAMFAALEKFDVSRVVTTIGATQPIFIFILTWFFWGAQPISAAYIFAFGALFIGSIIISIGKTPERTARYLKITILSSLMFSLDYIFSKLVFLNQPFLEGVIWIRIFVFLFALVFLLGRKSREEIFSRQIILNGRTQLFFIVAQTCGGVANFLQSLAIALAPIVFLATINSLRGIQYIFLFVVTIFMSAVFPRILKEELSGKIILQKAISIILIVTGLAILVF